MSWFGKTFGDGKRQSQKNTGKGAAKNAKEKDDKGATSGRQDKDSTVTSLNPEEVSDSREEGQRSNEERRRSSETNRSEGSFLMEDQARQVPELASELQRLRIEHDTVAELQQAHQSDISSVIKERDEYKEELEKLKRKYLGLQGEHQELLQREDRGPSDSACEASLTDDQNKDDINALRKMVEKLESENEKHVQECKTLKEDLEKLREENNRVNTENESVEVEKLKCDLNKKTEELDKEHKAKCELEDSNKQLKQMLDDAKAEESKFRTYIETEINKLLETFGAPPLGEASTSRILSEPANIIKAMWLKSVKERKDFEDASNKKYERLRKETENLRQVIATMENELRKENNERNKMEARYREEVDQLQGKCADLQGRVDDSNVEEVRRLRAEMEDLTEELETRSEELMEALATVQSLKREAREWTALVRGKELLERTVAQLEGELQAAEDKVADLEHEKAAAEERYADLEKEMNRRRQEIMRVEENQRESLRRMQQLEQETEQRAVELEKECTELHQLRIQLDREMEYLKSQVLIKEREARRLEDELTREVTRLRQECARLGGVEEELRNWKKATMDLELQKQNLSQTKEALERECLHLKACLTERQGAADLSARMNADRRAKDEAEALRSQIQILRAREEEQQSVILCLGEEILDVRRNYSEELKSLDDQVQEMYGDESGDTQEQCSAAQQQGRSRSRTVDAFELGCNIRKLKEHVEKQKNEHRELQKEHAALTERETCLKKEVERLKHRLIDAESEYAGAIDEYKMKLAATEEELKDMSTYYTSAKVKDNQRLESLQSEIIVLTAQRDHLQRTLASVEDEMRKQKDALTSFHVVLDQFQKDKMRELDSMAAKNEAEILTYERRLAEVQEEMIAVNASLSEAKTGLKAASILGDEIERKNQQIAELEKRLSSMATATKELEDKAAAASLSTSGKVDKSLVKNLLIGYISSQNADRKAQVLRIMTSVLDFDAEERTKIGVESTPAGWLSNLLNPRSTDSSDSSSSLSEAFIRFLESESQPRTQASSLLQQQNQASNASSSQTSSTPSPRPSLLLQDFVLPTFSTAQTESKDPKDSSKEG